MKPAPGEGMSAEQNRGGHFAKRYVDRTSDGDGGTSECVKSFREALGAWR